MSTTTNGIYSNCYSSANNTDTNTSILEILQCISNSLESLIDTSSALMDNTTATLPPDNNTIQDKNEAVRSMILVLCSALVFFMQAGFAMLCAGSVQNKNVQNTMLKNLLDACGAGVAYFMVGYAFAFGGTFDTTNNNDNTISFIGTENFFAMNVQDYSFWLYQFAFSASSTTIVAGALAERCHMRSYLYYSILLSGWVYPIVVHTIWSNHGYLSPFRTDPLFDSGMIDFSGSGVVHVTGGITALIAATILGPRRGRFHDVDGSELEVPREFPGSSIALQMLGVFILWFGWFGFNSGNGLLIVLNETSVVVATLSAVNTALAGGTGGLIALFCNLWYVDYTTGETVYDLKYAQNGVLAGLVTVTGSCGVIEPWAAIVAGCIGGIVYTFGTRFLLHVRVDDAVNAIPVHFFCGIAGVLYPAFVASPSRLYNAYGRNTHSGLFYTGDFVLLGIQCIGLCFIIVWVLLLMGSFFIWLDYMGWFRSDPLEEIVGLDTSYHGGLGLLLHLNNHNNTNPNGTEDISQEQLAQYQERRRQQREQRLLNGYLRNADHERKYKTQASSPAYHHTITATTYNAKDENPENEDEDDDDDGLVDGNALDDVIRL